MDELIETSTKEELREHLKDWRRAGEHIALVPTMGNLHEGHLELVKLARENAERVVVSIFVNPAQFGDGEDYESYPRTLERDRRRLKRARADLLFAPEVEVIYPFGLDTAASLTVPVLTTDLCGEVRPGHFDAVTSVIARLFSLVQPDVAAFGQRDYQQLLIIKRMVEDMGMPLTIVSAPTQREEDGLAMSSRNASLTDEERAVAPELYRTLSDLAQAIEAGEDDYPALEAQGVARLRAAGFEPDYVNVRRAEDLQPPAAEVDDLVVLGAARLGKARLLDNVLIEV